MEETTIKDLLDGEVVFTVPWSIWVDRDGKPRINGRYAFTQSSEGTSSMRIKKRGEDILVDIETMGPQPILAFGYYANYSFTPPAAILAGSYRGYLMVAELDAIGQSRQ